MFKRILNAITGRGDGDALKSKAPATGGLASSVANARWWASEFPEWAQAMKTHERFSMFMDNVQRYFERRKMPATFERDGIRVKLSGRPEDLNLGLVNLLQACHDADETNMRALIADQFDTMIRHFEQQDEIEKRMADWSFAEPRLRVRLWDIEIIDHVAQSVGRYDIPGLKSMLSADYPEAVGTVVRDMAKAWNRTDDELFAVAIENSLKDIQPELIPLDADDPSAPVIMHSDSYYFATIAMRPGAMDEVSGEHGAFVAIPTRHTIVVQKFDSLDLLNRVHHFVNLARTMFDDGPGAVSPRVWWVRDDVWCEVPYELKDDAIHMQMPDALAKYLGTLDE